MFISWHTAPIECQNRCISHGKTNINSSSQHSSISPKIIIPGPIFTIPPFLAQIWTFPSLCYITSSYWVDHAQCTIVLFWMVIYAGNCWKEEVISIIQQYTNYCYFICISYINISMVPTFQGLFIGLHPSTMNMNEIK